MRCQRDEDVHLRLVEHVAHVQASGYIRRGQQNCERRLSVDFVGTGDGGRLIEQPLLNPVLRPTVFNCGGIVCFRQVVRHTFLYEVLSTIAQRNHRSRLLRKAESAACMRRLPLMFEPF